jgi:uncharacterized delta-60 repeat protein
MFVFRWQELWKSSRARRRRPSTGRRLFMRRQPLRLELLEDRAVPSGGVVDTTFGQDGQVLTNFVGTGNAQARSVLINGSAGTVTEVGTSFGVNSAIALVSYHLVDGARDTAFGDNGEVVTAGLGGGVAGALLADGGIVVAADAGVARYTGAGSPDGSFGSGGEVTFADLGLSGFTATSTAVRDDHILVAGSRYDIRTGTYGLAVARLNSDGSLDTTFGVNGVATTDFSNFSNPNEMAVAPDGSIALAGETFNSFTGRFYFALARFTADGKPDTTFNGTGKQKLDLGGPAYAAAFEPDGAGGYQIVAGGGKALVRFNADGSLDATFGQGGAVVATDGFEVQSLTVQADGKIVTGDFMRHGASHRLSRYNADGSLDPLFGSDGHAYPPPEQAGMFALSLTGDGSMLVGGGLRLSPTTREAFSLTKYSDAGVVDTSFNGTGTATADFLVSADDFGQSVFVDSSGRIVEVGGSHAAVAAIALTRVNAQGARDTAFGDNGEVVTAGLGGGVGGALQADGSIVVAADAGVARYTGAGSPDGSFGSGGEVTFAGLGLSGFTATTTAVQDDHILVAGSLYDNSGAGQGSNFAVIRLNSDGSLDTTFGVNGVATADFYNSDDYGQGMAVAPDGSIALVGYAFNPVTNKSEFAMARFTADGQPDTTFNGTGRIALALGGASYAFALAFEPDGSGGYQLLVGGSGHDPSGALGTALVRFNADGSPDSTFGQGGVVLAGDGYQVRSLAVQADGKIVTDDYFLGLSRYNADGSPDAGFGSGGHAYPPGYTDTVAITGDGFILVGGTVHNATTGYDFSLFRYTSGNVTALTATAESAGANYSTRSQDIILRATLNSTAAAVNAGTVLFTDKDTIGNTVGIPVPGAVRNGAAQAQFALPPNSLVGAYTVEVSSSDAVDNFVDGGDVGAALTVQHGRRHHDGTKLLDQLQH